MHPKTKYEGPWSDVEKTPGLRTGEWRYQKPIMTREEKCSHCALCYIYCPAGCRLDKYTFFAVNLDYCKGCGICANSCPRGAITMVPESQGP